MTRESLRKILSIDVALLGGTVLSTLLACCSFLCGGCASSWAFYLGFGVPILLMSFYSWRRLGLLILMLVGISLVASVTITYTGTDALTCYVPMQRLIINGWNPVSQCQESDLAALSGGFAFKSEHIHALPRFTAVFGALVSKSLGTFTGDAFLGLVMISCLLMASWRFGLVFFRSHAAALALACVSAFCTKITSFMAGQIDYTIYASVLIAVYAAAVWQKERQVRDLLVVGLAMAIGFSVKASGAVFHLSLLIAVLVANGKSRAVWAMTGVLVAVTLVLCWSPYGVNTIANGTPMPKTDLTSDFTGNADALSMGWLARVTYAWISQALAVKGCALWHHAPDFHPEFHLGVGGIGGWFRVLMVVSVVLLSLSQRNLVWVVCLFIFISTNLLPVKYIGYSRYQYQMWVIPWLVLLNIACNPCDRVAQLVGRRSVRLTVSVLLLAVSSLTVVRTFAYGIRMYRFEEGRKAQIAAIRAAKPGTTWSLPRQLCAYTLSERLKVGGVAVSSDSADTLCSNEQYCFPGLTDLSISNCLAALDRAYPICDSPKTIMRFKWLMHAND